MLRLHRARGTDGKMLAESLLRTTSSSLAWLVFVVLVLTCASVIPLAAWLLRRQLPLSRRETIPLEAIRFGVSPKARRSPRHAVLQHRVLIATALMAALVVFLAPGIAALRVLGTSGLQVAIALVLPTLLIVLHARQRNLAR